MGTSMIRARAPVGGREQLTLAHSHRQPKTPVFRTGGRPAGGSLVRLVLCLPGGQAGMQRARRARPPRVFGAVRGWTAAGGGPPENAASVTMPVRELPTCLGLLACACLLPAPAAAQEFHEDLAHPCQDFWMVTRAEILECLRADYAAADAE